MRCWSCAHVFDGALGATACPTCGAVVPPHPATSPFTRLGYESPTFDVEALELEARWLKRSRAVHPDRLAKKSEVERKHAASQTAALNDAYQLLRDPIARADRLLKDLGVTVAAAPSPAFLDVMFEARDAARASPDAKQRVLDDARARWTATMERARAGFVAALPRGDGAVDTAALADVAADVATDVARATSELRYLARLLDELGAPPKDVVVHV